MQWIAASVVMLSGAIIAGCAAIADAIRDSHTPLEAFGLLLVLGGASWLFARFVAEHNSTSAKPPQPAADRTVA